MRLIEHWDSHDQRWELLIADLHTPRYFAAIDRAVRELGLTRYKLVDGIWFMLATYELPDAGGFTLIWHEDVGLYAYALQTGKASMEVLRGFLERLPTIDAGTVT